MIFANIFRILLLFVFFFQAGEYRVAITGIYAGPMFNVLFGTLGGSFVAHFSEGYIHVLADRQKKMLIDFLGHQERLHFIDVCDPEWWSHRFHYDTLCLCSSGISRGWTHNFHEKSGNDFLRVTTSMKDSAKRIPYRKCYKTV